MLTCVYTCFKKIYVFSMCVCVSVCMAIICTHACTYAHSLGGQQVVLSVTAGVKIVVKSSNMAVEPGSPAGAASAVSC